jgi:hypothetical protein
VQALLARLPLTAPLAGGKPEQRLLLLRLLGALLDLDAAAVLADGQTARRFVIDTYCGLMAPAAPCRCGPDAYH